MFTWMADLRLIHFMMVEKIFRPSIGTEKSAEKFDNLVSLSYSEHAKAS
jgi:hypothetical protein